MSLYRLSTKSIPYKLAGYSSSTELERFHGDATTRRLVAIIYGTKSPKDLNDQERARIESAKTRLLEMLPEGIGDHEWGEALNWANKNLESLVTTAGTAHPNEIRPLLELFFRLRRHMEPQLRELSAFTPYSQNRDKFRKGLSNAEDARKSSIAAALDKGKLTREIKQIGEANTRVIYSDDEWFVVVPFSQEASLLHGSKHWCTVVGKGGQPCSFDNYHDIDDRDFLYIVIHKPTGEKFQAHYGLMEFMDSKNRPLPYAETTKIHEVIGRSRGFHAKWGTTYDPDLKFFDISELITGDGVLELFNPLINHLKSAALVRMVTDNRGRPHAVDGPSLVSIHGISAWCQNGQLHRDGGPALHDKNLNFAAWFRNGLLTRDGDPAFASTFGTTVAWAKNGVITKKLTGISSSKIHDYTGRNAEEDEELNEYGI